MSQYVCRITFWVPPDLAQYEDECVIDGVNAQDASEAAKDLIRRGWSQRRKEQRQLRFVVRDCFRVS